jgi:hypothetical protein
MEYEAVRKWLRSFGITIIVLSIIELINTLLILNTQVSFKGKKLLVQDLIYSSGRLPETSGVIFIFLNCCIACFIVFGYGLIKIISYKDIDYTIMAKYILVLGVIIIIFAYVKMGYIAYLEQAKIRLNGDSITFRYFIWKYDTSVIGPYSLLISWTFYTATVCCYLIMGLIMAGGGLNWILELSKEQPEGN